MKRTEVTAEEFAAAQALYCDMMADGQGVKAALEATGLSHSQGDWAWYADPRSGDQHVPLGSVKLPDLPGKDDPGYEVAQIRRSAVIVEMRAGEHKQFLGNKLSFGQIAVACNVPEGQIHRAFKVSGIDSHGTRSGQGGRWLGDDPRYYTGNRKGIGFEHENPKSVDPSKIQADRDEVATVLPSTLSQMRKRISGGVVRKARATKKTTAKKASGTRKTSK